MRFPSTLTSSRALAGRFDDAALDATDADGITRREALKAFGVDPDAYAACSRAGRALGYVEVHIEQGPVLEAKGLPVGIVTAIAGATRGTIELAGEAGHSGTLPMEMRHDALAGAADMILALERLAEGHAGPCRDRGYAHHSRRRGECGAGRVRFSFDVRAPDDGPASTRSTPCARPSRRSPPRGASQAPLKRPMTRPRPPCDGALQAALAAAVAAEGIDALHLPSGAGHDGLSLNGVMPIAMLFVRSRNGSHNPREHASAEDIGAAARVLSRSCAAIRRAADPAAQSAPTRRFCASKKG